MCEQQLSTEESLLYYDTEHSVSIKEHPSSSSRKNEQQTISENNTNKSIYDIYSPRKRNIILFAVCTLGLLSPLCDTIYLPALPVVEKDLHTSYALVLQSVAIYLFFCGIFSLVWGSFSDYYGRKICLIVSSILFITTSIICIFTPNIIYLIIFRALQGASITATDAVGLGVIADVFAPTQRGFATGMFLIPFNIGPILGPVLGGSLSDSFGWRSTFVFLALYAFLTTIMILILLPETHQYFVLQRHQQALGSITIEVDLIHKPVFAAPWKPLSVLTDLSIAPYILLMTIAFTTFFMSLIALPDQLSSKPYNLNEAIIGFCYIPSGIGLLIGSALGGSLADRAGRYYSGKIPESRLIPASFGAFFVPVGLLFYGCSLHFKLNLTLVIIATFIVAFGHSVYEPAGFSYLTNKKQDEAGAISAVVIFLPFIFSGLGTVVAAPIIKAVGIGLLFSILAGLSIISIIIANTVVFVKVQQKKHSEKR